MKSRKILSLAVVSAISASCMVGRLDPQVAAEPNARAGACRATTGPDASTIAWSRPESAADRTQLDRWCQAVGPAVVESSRAERGLPDEPRGLTVVSWNAEVGGGDVVGFVTALRRGEIANAPAGNDFVLLLQEAFRAGNGVPADPGAGAESASAIRVTPPHSTRVDTVAAARSLGLFLYYAPSMRNGAHTAGWVDEDRGNAILSSRPLTDLRAIELPFERQRRVAVAATVGGTTSEGRPWQLRVVSAHLDNLAPRALWIFASRARERQARGLIAALPSDGFSVVGSDLNTWAGGTREPAYLALRQSFPETATPTYRSSGAGGLLLDYMFWRVEGRPAPNVHLVNDTFGSDHHPLVTTVSFDDLVPQQLLSVSRSH